ncbi:MAG TPA: NADH-quinone oxidoreductase subunit M [Tepidisphaeraceae bacterium]|nr:NADH-quinone oxidoreductase subunit M [Tepidisphaeraceae bacterium]
MLLPLLILIPLVGAGIGAFVTSRTAKAWALVVSLLTAAAAIGAAASFDFHASGVVQLQYPAATLVESHFGLVDIGFEPRVGVDSISLWLVLLTVLLMPPAILASFDSIKERPREYYAWMLVLLAAMNGVFISRDLLLFYIFFELTLIPMFFIIGIWGGPQRRYAAGKFFLFTFGGSVFTLAAVIYLGISAHSFDLTDVTRYAQQTLTESQRWWVLLGLLAGLAVKVPLFPVHTWLPLAHTEAPTAGSVILAGVLLKLGTYGLLRLVVPIGLVTAGGIAFYDFIYFLGGLCVIGILYGALVAWVQQDIKKLVAYSSVSHLGFCVLGLAALNAIGMQGSVLYMINHGLSTGAMFLVIGMIYDRFHTRDINELSGLARKLPRLAFFFVFFMLSSIGLPGLNGFVSEFLTVLGAFTSDRLGITFGVFAAIGVILGALYMLHMTARVIFGPLKYPGFSGTDEHGHGAGHEAHEGTSHAPVSDIGAREIGLLLPIAAAVILLGILPRSVLSTIASPIDMLLHPVPARSTAQAPVQSEPLVITSARP